MKSLTLQQRLKLVESQQALAANTMRTILLAANCESPEHLTGVSAEAWQAESKVSHDLDAYLQRINSILDSAEKYIIANVD